jgi:hypothetical protein
MIDQQQFKQALVESPRFTMMLAYAQVRVQREITAAEQSQGSPRAARLGAIFGCAIVYSLETYPISRFLGEEVSVLVRGKAVTMPREEYEQEALAVLWEHFQLDQVPA